MLKKGGIMDRLSSTVAVLIMVLVAVSVCVWHTIGMREVIGENVATILIAFQVLIGACIAMTCASMLRNRFVSASNARKKPFAASRNRRRLSSAVWS